MMTDEEVQMKQFVDLDIVVPCESTEAECPNPASWRWTHCCIPKNLCHTHHVGMLQRMNEQIEPGKRYACSNCNADPMPEPKWRKL